MAVFHYGGQRVRVTSLMTRVAKQLKCTPGPDFVDLLIERFDELGLVEAANQCGIPPSTLSYWFRIFSINLTRVAVKPGYHVEVLADKA